MNPPDPADMAYPTSEALRACRLTPARWARAQAIRDKPHQTEELICALVNEVEKLTDQVARADVRDDDGSDPTV